jgi:5'-3' exonuclease
MQIFTVKVMISLLNSAGEDIKPIKILDIKPRKSRQQKLAEEKARKEREEFEKLMRNIDSYDGSGLGQEEVNLDGIYR